MGRLIVSTMISLDGVMDVDEWFVAEGGHDLRSKEQLRSAEALLLGRKTFEGLADSWQPLVGDGGYADLLEPMPKWVASRTLAPDASLPWNGRVLEDDLVAGVQRLKANLDGDLLVYGCGELARYLTKVALADELRFWVHPRAWGRPGTRPFGEGPMVELAWLGAEGFGDSGVTLLRYKPT